MSGSIAFDAVLNAGDWRYATEKDFADFRVSFHPEYIADNNTEQIP